MFTFVEDCLLVGGQVDGDPVVRQRGLLLRVGHGVLVVRRRALGRTLRGGGHPHGGRDILWYMVNILCESSR